MLAFGLNHMTLSRASTAGVMDVARVMGCVGVELRNDLDAPLFDDMTPDEIAAMARAQGLRILALAEVYGFNDPTRDTLAATRTLIAQARASGAEAVVLIPAVADSAIDRGTQRAWLQDALTTLHPLFDAAGITGLIEPLGFTNSSLRFKSDVAEVLANMGLPKCFGIIHDTFHHHLAQETDVFGALTRIVHVSGVTDAQLEPRDMQDADRGLVDANDRLGNIEQLTRLRAAGFDGPVSFEAFAPDVHDLHNPIDALVASKTFITSHLAALAA